MSRKNIQSELPEGRGSHIENAYAVNEPEADATATCRLIAETLQRSGVSAEIKPDTRNPGSYVIVNVPRGRLPTVERVMTDLGLPWRQK